MPDFFGTFDPAGAVKDVAALAMKKMDLDNGAARLKIASEQWGMQKDALKLGLQKQEAFKQGVSDFVAQTGRQPTAQDLLGVGASTGAVTPEEQIKSQTTLETNRLKPIATETLIAQKLGLGATPEQVLTELAKQKQAERAPKTETSTSLVLQGLPPDATPEMKLRAIATQKQQETAGKSKTEEQLTAAALEGDTKAQAVLDAMQKRRLAIAEKQRAIIDRGQGEQKFAPGTLDFMVSKYETDGQIPPFGMGSVGAKQRKEFFDKAAQRAKERGGTGADQSVRTAEFKANQSTLSDLTKREQIIKSFDVRINKTSDEVLIPLIKEWDLQNPRFANWTVNELAKIMGSGKLASLKLALNSVSNEVGKVEFNALGMVQLSDSASKVMNSIHDENMKVKDLLEVVETSRKLGKTGSEAISGQRKELLGRIKQISPDYKEPGKSGRDTGLAANWLKSVSNPTMETKRKMVKELKDKGWTSEEATAAVKGAGWE